MKKNVIYESVEDVFKKYIPDYKFEEKNYQFSDGIELVERLLKDFKLEWNKKCIRQDKLLTY